MMGERKERAAMKKTRIALLLALLLSLSACGTAASDSPMLAADSSVSAGAADASKEDATPAASADDVPASEADADDAPAPEGAETAETESALLTPGNVVKSETERIANAVADQVPQVETSAVEQSVEADDGTQVMRYEGLEFTVTLPAHPDIAELIQADLNGAAALETDEQLEEQALEDYQYALDENLDWVAYIAGKRESRRLMGDWVYSERDVTEKRPFEDSKLRCADRSAAHPEKHLRRRSGFRCFCPEQHCGAVRAGGVQGSAL